MDDGLVAAWCVAASLLATNGRRASALRGVCHQLNSHKWMKG